MPTNRGATLKATPANSFAYEVRKLVPSPTDGLKAVETSGLMARAEALGLPEQQAFLIQQIRRSQTGAEAFAEGASLPASVRLYTAGAVDFHRKDMTEAIPRFEAVIQLPESDKLRATSGRLCVGAGLWRRR